ncbi:hypothetical protein [Nocardia sp. CA-290969]|uniref:hypothetical protein n=1 Tax=Nocardia sp. CA-290969 TaxID=3239986 RepID=UPI003D9379AD
MRIARSAYRLLPVLAAALALTSLPASAQPGWGPLGPANPHLGPLGTATMHGDAGSSDVTPLAGPGTGWVTPSGDPLAAACPTILQGSDGMVVALCTAIVDRAPTVYLFDPAKGPIGPPAAKLSLTKGSLLGGVYAYLDNENRLVVVDGERRLLRIAHSRGADGKWSLAIGANTDLTGGIPADDAVTGLVPDWSGNVWFATGGGLVGKVGRDGAVTTHRLPAGERVANSISSSPDGVAVATTHALYEFAARGSGAPKVRWRAAYDRGSARKPGQLSWGTGSTPTYFGPGNGTEYLTIVDNADDQVHLLVYRADSGELVCNQPVLTEGGPGSENSPIGIGRSVFVASTYGYPYPTVPDDAGPAEPAIAPFSGGMTRVDIDDQGCHTVWENDVRSAAVPKLSAADGNIYTVLRLGLGLTTPLDGYAYGVVDPATGEVTAKHPMSATIVADTLQMAGLTTTNGELWQGTITGIMRIR